MENKTNMQNDSFTFEKCPYCGCRQIDVCSLSLTRRYYFCKCVECGAQTEPDTDKAKAIQKWNRRV